MLVRRSSHLFILSRFDGASVDVGRLSSLQARGSPSFCCCLCTVHIYTDLTLVRQDTGASLVKCLRVFQQTTRCLLLWVILCQNFFTFTRLRYTTVLFVSKVWLLSFVLVLMFAGQRPAQLFHDGSFHDYDDNNHVGGYTIPIDGFTEDAKMATIVMRRLTWNGRIHHYGFQHLDLTCYKDSLL